MRGAAPETPHYAVLRRALWRFVAARWRDYCTPGGIRHFLADPAALQAACETANQRAKAAVEYQHPSEEDELRYLYCDTPDSPGTGDAIRTIGIRQHLGNIDFAAGVMTIRDNIIPEVLAGED